MPLKRFFVIINIFYDRKKSYVIFSENAPCLKLYINKIKKLHCILATQKKEATFFKKKNSKLTLYFTYDFNVVFWKSCSVRPWSQNKLTVSVNVPIRFQVKFS